MIESNPRPNPSLHWLLAGLLGTLLLAVISTNAAIADGGQRQPVRINAATREQRAQVADLVAIEEVGKGYVVAFATSREIDQLRQLGYTVELLPVLLDFPPQDSDYHNYTEMLAELNQTVADHGDIVDLFSIGQTWQGRDLWMMKISDNPQVDEEEPEVFYVCLHHAREHLTVEMCLSIIAYFTDNYGLLDRVTQLVDQREIYVLTAANPDGAEYDVAGGGYRWWRKNLRDNDGNGGVTPLVDGVDLNRNYSYAWGGTGSDGATSSEIYRGPYPFSEPETQAIRDFVNDHPDIGVAISFHTYGELVLWPYGYTYADVPPDMDPIDHQVLVALGQAMAQTNGYTAMQASDLYPASGVWDDWMYGAHGIFAFTFEMYPPSYPPGFYPGDDVIPAETARNIEAVLMLAEYADNPYRILGQTPTPTATATFTPSPTATSTATATRTPTATQTASATATATKTATSTSTPTATATATQTTTPTATPRPCPMREDFSGNNVIDVDDITRVLENWGRNVADDPTRLPQFDLDHSGKIDIVDIMLVAARWGEQCAV